MLCTVVDAPRQFVATAFEQSKDAPAHGGNELRDVVVARRRKLVKAERAGIVS
jgi:hypothetical protein